MSIVHLDTIMKTILEGKVEEKKRQEFDNDTDWWTTKKKKKIKLTGLWDQRTDLVEGPFQRNFNEERTYGHYDECWKLAVTKTLRKL